MGPSVLYTPNLIMISVTYVDNEMNIIDWLYFVILFIVNVDSVYQ